MTLLLHASRPPHITLHDYRPTVSEMRDEVVCALLTSLTSRLFMNLSFVLWQVWMQLVMYRWMNSEGRSTAWGEGVGGDSLQASTQTQFMFTNSCTIAIQRVLVETFTPEQTVTQLHTRMHTCTHAHTPHTHASRLPAMMLW